MPERGAVAPSGGEPHWQDLVGDTREDGRGPGEQGWPG